MQLAQGWWSSLDVACSVLKPGKSWASNAGFSRTFWCLNQESPKKTKWVGYPSPKTILGRLQDPQWKRIHLPMQEMQVWPLGWEDPLEEEMTTHSSVLSWKIPWTGEPVGLQSMGLKRVGHDWAAEHTTELDSRVSYKEISTHPGQNGRY